MPGKRNEVPPKGSAARKQGRNTMKRLTRSEIKAELEKPNGSAEIMNDSTIDKISLCDETTAMFIEENIGSALMIRLAKAAQCCSA